MAFFYSNSLSQNLNSLPELVVSNSTVHKNGFKSRYQLHANDKKQSVAKIDVKSLTRIPAESPAQIYKKAQLLTNDKENSKLTINLRGFSTPKNLKSMCSVISEKQTNSTLTSVNKANPQRKLQKQTTLNLEEPQSLKQSQIFSSFSDFCDSQSSNCKTPSDDTQSQATSDTGSSHDTGDTVSKASDEKEHVKTISFARLKSFKDINDAHNRHIEQKELLIAKYKSLSTNLDAELKKKNELIASQNKLIASLQNSVQSYTEQLAESEINVSNVLKQYSTIRNEINEQRKEAPEFQTLLDENLFLKQQSKRSLQTQKTIEDSHVEYKNLLSNINGWAAIAALPEPTPEQLDEFLICRVSDYTKRREEQSELSEKYSELRSKFEILTDDYQRLQQEKRILKATIEMQECRIESIRDNDGYSKIFKQLTGISMEGIENDLMTLKKSIQERQALNNDLISDEDKKTLLSIDYLKMQVENVKNQQLNTQNHIKSIEAKLKDQLVNVQKYRFIEELDAMERHANTLLKCNRCNSNLYNSITHVPCGHSFCMDCHEDRKQKIELNDQIPFDQKQGRICACCICGQDKKGNFVFKNQQMDQVTAFYKQLIKHKDLVKLLVSKF